MEIIKALLSDFDPSTLLPKLDTLLGKVELLARIVVMIGPVVLLVLGLWYLLLPPKEANHSVGYRFFWGMSSVESWQFTQLVAGAAWSVLGLLLSIIIYLLSGSFRGMEMMDIVWKAVKYIFWEMGIIAVSCLFIDLTVVFTFNSKGVRRREKKNKGKTEAEVVEEEVKKLVHDVNEKLHQKPDLEKIKALPQKLVKKKEDTKAAPAGEAPGAEAAETPRQTPVQAAAAEELPAKTADEPAQAPERPEGSEAPVQEDAGQVAQAPAAQETQAPEPAEDAPAEQTPAAGEAPAAVPPYQQKKNPYGTKKRYPNGTKKKGKK